MAVQIILIRHGIAGDREPGQSDFDRKLTKKGRQRLLATLPILKPLLGEGRIQIWSSPLVRAQETSQIAAGVFNIKKLVTYDFIGEGYFNGFLKAVEELDSSAAHTILVVGHEPDMGYWAEALCGAFLPFKKGAAAGFLFSGGDPGSADLQWFFQPETMELLPDRDESDKILNDIRDILQVHMRQVLKEHGSFIKEPTNHETAHRLRVSIRRLRSLLFFLKPYQNDKQNTSIQESLKKFVGELSCLRELDVLRETCETFTKINPCKAAASASILGMLDEERVKEAVRAVASVSGADSLDSLRVAQRCLEEPEWKKYIDENESIKTRINRRFSEMFEEFEHTLNILNYDDAAAVHALRIDAKKLKYALGSLEPLAEIKSGIIGTELAAAHEILGHLCDARCNKALLQKFNARDLPDEVHRVLLEMIDTQDRFLAERLNFLKS